MKRRNAGFTLVELMVVLAITGLFVVLAIVGYRQGIYKEYGLSQQMRSMVNGLHVTQWRALQNKMSVIVSSGTSSGTVITPGSWYPEVTFVTATEHGLKDGDLVVFANLTAHTSMNVGRFYVNYVDTTSFTVDFYTQVSTVDTDPGSGSTVRPTVANTRTSSQLVIMKMSYVKAQTQTLQNTYNSDPQYYIYDDNQFLIWDATKTSTLSTSDVEDTAYQLTIAFDFRGMPRDQAGYQLALGRTPADLKARKYITVSPTGRIAPGA